MKTKIQLILNGFVTEKNATCIEFNIVQICLKGQNRRSITYSYVYVLLLFLTNGCVRNLFLFHSKNFWYLNQKQNSSWVYDDEWTNFVDSNT